jgi:hypothetical protein
MGDLYLLPFYTTPAKKKAAAASKQPTFFSQFSMFLLKDLDILSSTMK